jgi:hypothetical protein
MSAPNSPDFEYHDSGDEYDDPQLSEDEMIKAMSDKGLTIIPDGCYLHNINKNNGYYLGVSKNSGVRLSGKYKLCHRCNSVYEFSYGGNPHCNMCDMDLCKFCNKVLPLNNHITGYAFCYDCVPSKCKCGFFPKLVPVADGDGNIFYACDCCAEVYPLKDDIKDPGYD